MRKTKIICTLGPATDVEGRLEELIHAGMDVARFNFSHQTHPEHKARFDKLVEVRERLGVPVAALLDTKGPEVRLGLIEGGKAELLAGDMFTLTTRDVMGSNQVASISYKGLPRDVKPGDRILIDDGLIELILLENDGENLVCQVVNGGRISDRKGVNVPNVSLSMPFLSDKDREDILFGIRTGFDFIAASFTRTADDILQIRRLLSDNGVSHIKIIAKIENTEGVDNIDEIIKVSDGIMVARGYMGVEISYENIPVLQKRLISKAYEAGKQVITATQMLDSMMKNPRPTRAEITDVANAIYDGTSAIMLSGETAGGKYPVQSVEAMARIALETEKHLKNKYGDKNSMHIQSPADALSHSACVLAEDIGAKAIVVCSRTGGTARLVSKYRPNIDIIGMTIEPMSYRKLALSWGVQPVLA